MATLKKHWSPDEVESAIRAERDPTKLALLDFAKKHGADGKLVSEGRKAIPSFGFYVKGRCSKGYVAHNITFVVGVGKDALKLYCFAEDLLSKEEVSEYHHRLIKLFGNVFTDGKKEPTIPLAPVRRNLVAFEELMLWLQSRAAAGISSS